MEDVEETRQTNEESLYFYLLGYIISSIIIIISIYINSWIKHKKKLKIYNLNKKIPYEVYNLAKTSFIANNREKCIKLITRYNYDINYPICEDKFNLFLCACFSGDCKLVEFMLERNANVKATNKYGDSPLYLFTYAYFFYGCDFGAVDALIEAGCDVNFPNERGYTPLHLAAAKGSYNMTLKLLRKGALPNIKNKAGILPIQLAIVEGHKRIVDLLLMF